MAIYTDDINDKKADRYGMYKPWAALVADSKIYIPKKFTDFFKDKLGMSQDASNVAAHTLASAALVAAGIGVTRVGYELLSPGRDNPSSHAKMRRHLNNVDVQDFGYDDDDELQSKKASITGSDAPESMTGANFISSFAPLAASAVLAAGAYGLADKIIAKGDKAYINNRIVKNEQLRNDLIKARAKLAKGNLSEEEYEELMERVSKQASLSKSASVVDWIDKAVKSIGPGSDKDRATDHADVIWSSLGLLCAGLFTASGIAAYKYMYGSDPNNLKYRAKKLGLEEYARAKARANFIDTRLTEDADDQYKLFNEIDTGNPARARRSSGPKVKGASVSKHVTVTPEEGIRGGVTVDSTDLNRPISITL